MKTQMYLYDKMPKDPGTMTRFGASTWKPTDAQVHEFSLYLRGAMDPAGVFERTVSGQVTPQETDALRTLNPAHFELIQRSILNNIDDIRKHATYDQVIRQGILFGVPTDTTISPKFVQFVQGDIAQRAAERKPLNIKQPGGGPSNTADLSTAQKLQLS